MLITKKRSILRPPCGRLINDSLTPLEDLSARQRARLPSIEAHIAAKHPESGKTASPQERRARQRPTYQSVGSDAEAALAQGRHLLVCGVEV